MSFFARVLNHLVNEVLVNSLANNRTFQQIAVRSNAWVADIAKKSAFIIIRTSECEHYELYTSHLALSVLSYNTCLLQALSIRRRLVSKPKTSRRPSGMRSASFTFPALLRKLMPACCLPVHALHPLVDVSSGVQMKKGIDKEFKQK